MTQQVRNFFRRILDLRKGSEEKLIIIERVKDDADISSARFWTLVFAIGVASVGLNINSIPVVIGAMLISPLMGPVVSMGLALSINDWGLMRRSVRNLLILVGISIFISTLYFALTPISNAQSELLSRIQPTIFDVLIAIFGGMAGFIGISRARHNNVIPGVAIATALMPPLCTVGYGIGTMQPKFIFGAFFLFLINCIFICLSALAVASFMKLPKRDYPDLEHKIKVKRIITAIIVVIVTPAIYLAYTFVDQNNFQLHSAEYIETVFAKEGHVVIYKNLTYGRKDRVMELAFLNEIFSAEQIAHFENRLKEFKLNKTKLIIRQNGYSLTDDERRVALSDVQLEAEKNQALEDLLESERQAFQNPDRLLSEVKVINNKITNISIGDMTDAQTGEGGVAKETAVIVTTDGSLPLTPGEAVIIDKWLKIRLAKDNIKAYFIPLPVELEVATTTIAE